MSQMNADNKDQTQRVMYLLWIICVTLRNLRIKLRLYSTGERNVGLV